MSARERLETVLGVLQARLRRQIWLRAIAAGSLAALLLVIAAVLWTTREQFSPSVVFAARIVLAGGVLITVAALLIAPLRRLRANAGAETFERCMPEQQGRIRTYLDARRGAGPSLLLDLLAEDALERAQRTPPESIVTRRRLGATTLACALALLGVGAMLWVAPAPWDFAARHVLLGAELPRTQSSERRLLALPGDATVRRNSDLAIGAAVEGFAPNSAEVYVRFEGETQWERAPMRATLQERTPFEFMLYAVRGPLSYYIEAQGVRTPEHRVQVVDLPRIERVRLTYTYPQWTGLAPRVEDQERNIAAVAGTNVQVEVFADAPLEDAALIVNGATEKLTSVQGSNVGVIDVANPGTYRIGAHVANEFVALSEDYIIEITPDEKPTIEIRKPGRDARASSIEEVPVRVEAQDDFRLRNVELRYAVNGGEQRSLALAPNAGPAQAMLRLEDLGASRGEPLEPGDLITYFAVASDRQHTVQTDLYMVQVQPFERRYTQGQAGGQQGGGMEQEAISDRQREILLATWNLQRNEARHRRTPAQRRDQAALLAELQGKLAEQTRTLAARTRVRAAGQDERIDAFIARLEEAAQAMAPAARELEQMRLAEAVPMEQQALQLLLRAEETFRDVQVAMQQEGASGGGDGSRSFNEMFELEMDLEKSQYETESQATRRGGEEESSEALRKLKELAARQEQLAEQAQRNALTREEQRWRQEQLRREAEDLRRRLAELNGKADSSSQAQRDRKEQGTSEASEGGGSQQGAQASAQADARSDSQQSAQGASQSSTRGEQRLERTLNDVNRALERMRAANQQAASDPQQAQQSSRAASEDLQRALRNLGQPEGAGLEEALAPLAGRAGEALREQQRIEGELNSALGGAGSAFDPFSARGMDRSTAQALVESKQRLAEQLADLQRDLRAAAQEHRGRSPQASQRLSESVHEFDASEAMYRLNRSAAEVYYGRLRDAALREGVITEAIERLEENVREASAQAAQEARQGVRENASDALLSQAAELRRALESAQPDAAGSQAGSAPSDADSWRNDGAPDQRIDPRSLARETAQLSERVRTAAYRLNSRQLTAEELAALRERASQLRRLANASTVDVRAMLQLVDQIELSAVRAAERTRRAGARASAAAPDVPEHREAVAEYYRRLGAR